MAGAHSKSGTETPLYMNVISTSFCWYETILSQRLCLYHHCVVDDDSAPSKDLGILPAYSSVDLVQPDPLDKNGDPWDLPELKDMGPKWSGEGISTTIPNAVCMQRCILICTELDL